jgi:ABC-type bacteriocin/lantibiotic exporter with double-glycine peptidase domain
LSETLGVISIAILIIILTISGKSNSEIITLTAVYAAVAFRLIPASTRIIAALQRIKNYAPSLNLIEEEFLNLDQKNINIIEKKIEPLKFENIKLKNINFSYEQSNNSVFTNINFEINKGEIIGLYGESGSGKSTLINLISGLIEPSSGTIKINERKLKDTKESWLASLGYVPQQVTLFNDTISKNISFFEKEVEKKKINNILEKSNLSKFINDLPEKENTIVGENSATLSGGQIQRIGIARALYNDPEFIIFDESTNSLDPINENEIMEFIYSLKGLKTILIISHDKKVLSKCNKIFEIKNKNINQIE